MLYKSNLISYIIRIYLLFVFILLPAYSAAQNIQVKDIPRIDRLSTNRINEVFQDTEGYIWYGTEEGLYRDDGYDIYTIRSNFKMPDMLLDNAVICLGEDSITHNIWIGSNNGVYILNKQTFDINPIDIKELKEETVEGILVSSDRYIWICTYRKIFRLSPEGKLLKSYSLKCKQGPGKEYCLYEDRQKQLLLSISGLGLHKWNEQKKDFELVFPYEDRVNDIIQDNKNSYYWLATWGHGIIRLDISALSREQQYVQQNLPVNSVGEKASTALGIVQDDVNDYIWIVSWSDLFACQITPEQKLEQIETSSFLPKWNKVLKSIMKDKDGNLWVTSLDNHNFIISFNEEDFFKYNVDVLKSQLKATPFFELLCKDEKGVFWVFQRRVGLCVYDPKKNRIESYRDQTDSDKNRFLVLSCLLKSKTEGLVWVVVEGSQDVYGLEQEDLKIKIRHKISLNKISKRYRTISRLFEDNNGNLYIAVDDGLYVYHSENNSLKIISEDIGRINRITQTKNGDVWGILQDTTLVKVDMAGNLNIYPFSESLACITADDDKLWLGTNKGEILLFDPLTKNIENFTIACGMNGDRINELISDAYHHIWIVTGQSVKEFNPQNGAYRIFYAASKEIGVHRFLPNAVYEDKNGILYFGGLPGILGIVPSQHLNHASQSGKVLITDIRILGKSILPDTDRLNKSSKSIDIYPGEQNIEIFFSSLDYQHSSQIRYAYCLSNVDEEWVYLPAGENMAFYNKLKKGNYKFQVKATDENGLWHEQIVEFRLNRLPAWYETWYAYSLYLLLVLTALFYLYKAIRNRIRMQHAIEMGKIERQKIEEINHAKLQFFTNITHELLTPLSIISASVDEMKTEMPGNSRFGNVIENNTSRLIRLIQQILEFRKVENGKLKLKVSYGNISHFLANSVSSFTPLLRKKGQAILFDGKSEDCLGYFDVDKLDKIIYNLLSNASKYTQEGCTITLRQYYDKENGLLTISVNNPGEYIPKERLAHLFERFYEGEYRKFHTIGTGIGLSLTKDLVTLHHGTIHAISSREEGNTFIVEIPISRDAFTEEEIDESVEYADYNVLPASEVEELPVAERAECEPGTPSLLLVEDNEELLASMVRLLQGRYSVLQARNGMEALAVLEKEEVKLVVSDVMMPEMDGMELCRRVKEKFETCHIPVILLTAKITDEDRVMGYESGADGYICKPLRLSVLLAKIDNLLKKSNRMGIDFRKQLVFEAKELNYTSMDEAFIQKAVDCVNAHLDDCDFEHAQFLSEMGMARTTLAEKLKLLTGLTPSGFINNVRLQAACRLIDEKKKMRISDLAYAVGFNDPKYFSLCFKKKFGLTPTEYMVKYER